LISPKAKPRPHQRIHAVLDQRSHTDNVLHGLASLLNQYHPLFDAAGRTGNQCLDLASGLGTSLRKRTNLASYHGEAPAIFTSACRLDRRVQREDVGLECDAIDRANDVGDPVRACADEGLPRYGSKSYISHSHLTSKRAMRLENKSRCA
jgi:hypothetical protein